MGIWLNDDREGSVLILKGVNFGTFTSKVLGFTGIFRFRSVVRMLLKQQPKECKMLQKQSNSSQNKNCSKDSEMLLRGGLVQVLRPSYNGLRWREINTSIFKISPSKIQTGRPDNGNWCGKGSCMTYL